VRLQTTAPAKLNLCLYVGERRADGLHEICSLFQAITLADVVTMEALPQGSTEDEIVCPGVEGENLAAVALARFRERYGWQEPKVRVTIDKQIPVAAGLGGGSADAGAVLRLAVRGGAVPAHREELQELAMTIGADVPSQVEPASHLVLGAGEVVERLPKHWEIAGVMLTSNDGLSTASVYAHADRLVNRHDRRHFERDATRLQHAVTAASYSPIDLMDVLRNDLEPAAIDLYPLAGRALDLLYESGARMSRLSGSGPTAFGLFDTPAEAEAAQTKLARRWEGGVHVISQAPSSYAVVRTL
jgi:4-diphosphocytidyl-2-C-methyl-D-erythritol kinase